MFQILVLSLNTIFNCQNLFKSISFHIISSYFIIGFIWCQVWGVSSHPSLLLEPLSLWSQLFETVAKPQMLTKKWPWIPWIQGPSNVSHFCILNIIRFLLVFFAAGIHFPFSFGTLGYSQFPSPIPIRKQRSQRHVVWMISWHRASNVKLCMSFTLVHARQDAATILVNSTGSHAHSECNDGKIIECYGYPVVPYRTVSSSWNQSYIGSTFVRMDLGTSHWWRIFKTLGSSFFRVQVASHKNPICFPATGSIILCFDLKKPSWNHETSKKTRFQVPQLQSVLSFGKGCCVGNLLSFVGFSSNGRSQSPNGN